VNGPGRAGTSESRDRLGVLGGTFDPIHFGHLDAADAARKALGLEQVLFIPAHDSPLRAGEPHAAGFHRFAMAALAINGCPGYRVSDLELSRAGRSYTIDTLRELHTHGWLPSQLHFIVGADAFAEVARWRGYPEILDAARFVVISRPGTSLADAVPAQLRGNPRVIPVEAHTRDVSSTVIRRRLAEHKPIDDLVPGAVARHIVAHALYTTLPLEQR
jgi:nicotinate-nucleotide adenylyltransferase